MVPDDPDRKSTRLNSSHSIASRMAHLDHREPNACEIIDLIQLMSWQIGINHFKQNNKNQGRVVIKTNTSIATKKISVLSTPSTKINKSICDGSSNKNDNNNKKEPSINGLSRKTIKIQIKMRAMTPTLMCSNTKSDYRSYLYSQELYVLYLRLSSALSRESSVCFSGGDSLLLRGRYSYSSLIALSAVMSDSKAP